ncbi:MAG: hypothetical protein AAGC83_11870 [Pseudomonadota bacterium]
MSFATFKILEFVLFFGAAFGFVIWQMLDTEKAIARSKEKAANASAGASASASASTSASLDEQKAAD